MLIIVNINTVLVNVRKHYAMPFNNTVPDPLLESGELGHFGPDKMERNYGD